MKEVLFRAATREDLPDIVRMLADDELGSRREKAGEPLPESYYGAFEQINSDPSHQLIVAESNGRIIGTLHLIFLPSISYQGGLRAQIDSVRVDREYRNLGIGSEMMKWAIEHAKERGAHIVQLTTHNSRENAHRFYERLEFEKSHLGMKLSLK
jgi:ribosomal protein S18 acetylase RimI-like enzyme